VSWHQSPPWHAIYPLRQFSELQLGATGSVAVAATTWNWSAPLPNCCSFPRHSRFITPTAWRAILRDDDSEVIIVISTCDSFVALLFRRDVEVRVSAVPCKVLQLTFAIIINLPRVYTVWKSACEWNEGR